MGQLENDEGRISPGTEIGNQTWSDSLERMVREQKIHDSLSVGVETRVRRGEHSVGRRARPERFPAAVADIPRLVDYCGIREHLLSVQSRHCT